MRTHYSNSDKLNKIGVSALIKPSSGRSTTSDARGESQRQKRLWKIPPKTILFNEKNRNVLSKLDRISYSKLNTVFLWLEARSTITPWREQIRVLSSTTKRSKIEKFLLASFLYGEINPRSYEALILLAIEWNIEDLLLLWKFHFKNKYPLSTLRVRYNAFRRLKGITPLRKEITENSSMILLVEEKEVHDPAPPTERYSGWARHQNDHGSLRITDDLMEDNARPIEIFSKKGFDWEDILPRVLSVGILPPGREDEDSLKKAIISAETDKYVKLIREEYEFETSLRI